MTIEGSAAVAVVVVVAAVVAEKPFVKEITWLCKVMPLAVAAAAGFAVVGLAAETGAGGAETCLGKAHAKCAERRHWDG